MHAFGNAEPRGIAMYYHVASIDACVIEQMSNSIFVGNWYIFSNRSKNLDINRCVQIDRDYHEGFCDRIHRDYNERCCDRNHRDTK